MKTCFDLSNKATMFAASSLLMILFTTSSCSKSQKRSGVFKVAVRDELSGVHPFFHNNFSQYVIESKVFERLLKWNFSQNKYDLVLLDSLDFSKDYKSAVLVLKKNIGFHGGGVFTAKDIAYYIDCAKRMECSGSVFLSTYDNIQSVKVLSDYSVRFFFKEGKIENEKVISSIRAISSDYYKQREGDKATLSPQGTGPYSFFKFDKVRKRISLKKNQDWWGFRFKKNKGLHNFKTLEFTHIKDNQVIIDLLKQGRINFSQYIPYGVYKQYEFSADLNLIDLDKKNKNTFYGFRWNFNNEILKEKSVRKALSLLIDKDFINEKLFDGSKLSVSRPIFTGFAWKESNKKTSYNYNPEEALRLLHANGWADSDKNGVLDKDGKELRFEVIIPRREYERVLSMIKENYKKYGIVMDIKLLDLSLYFKSLKEKKADATYSSVLLSSFIPQVFFKTEGVANFQSYSNSKMDELINKTQMVKNKSQLPKLYKKIEDIVEKDFVMSFTFLEKSFFFGTSNNIEVSSPDGFFQIDYSSWKFKKKP